MTTPANRPLTVVDAQAPGHGLPALAERIAAHLPEGWHASTTEGRGPVLLGPGQERLRLLHGWGNQGQRLLVVSPAMPDKATVTASEYLNLYLLPSQAARIIQDRVLPPYRRVLRRSLDAQARSEAHQAARLRHAQAVADRLGEDWDLAEGPQGISVARSEQRTRVYGRFHWSPEGRLSLDLRNLPTEAVEHALAGVLDHLRRHETGRPVQGKRPQRLDYLLQLMVAAGYRIDKLSPEHKELFDPHLFKMDNRAVDGQSLVDYLLTHPGSIDRAIATFEQRTEG